MKSISKALCLVTVTMSLLAQSAFAGASPGRDPLKFLRQAHPGKATISLAVAVATLMGAQPEASAGRGGWALPKRHVTPPGTYVLHYSPKTHKFYPVRVLRTYEVKVEDWDGVRHVYRQEVR